MSVAVGSLRFNAVELIALNDTKRIDLTNSVVFVDYFEDILSPCVTMNMQIATGNSIFNTLPIRGGEKVVFDISTATGNFTLDGDYGMYVYKVSGYASDGQKEMFTLHLVPIS